MRITIELEPRDIAGFRKALARSRRIARTADECDILDAAKHALNTLVIGNAPDYVRKRMVGVQRLIVMLEDTDWALSNPERGMVLETLVYFGDPEDLIPDEIEGIGLLDDALMIELLLRHQRHTLEAYADFCAHRRIVREKSPERSDELLSRKREALHIRMRRRFAHDKWRAARKMHKK